MSTMHRLSATEPLPLNHSWPLTDRARRFELGLVLNCAVTELIKPSEVGALGIHHAGCWECDLSDNSLAWSGGVYDIFGFPRGMNITRQDALQRYSQYSRAAMENLRDYAIRHRRGFTIDVEIWPGTGSASRWMRLIAAPDCEGDEVVCLRGLKLII